MTEEKKEDLTLEELKKKIEELEQLKNEYLSGWQRARADFLNYKKEEIERIGELLKYVTEPFVSKLLPVLDSFDRAEKEAEKGNDKELVKGFLQIKTQLQDFLKSQGVEEIKSVGEKFDPNFHEAVAEIEGGKPGIILEELQKGYKIHERVIRFAKVKVSK